MPVSRTSSGWAGGTAAWCPPWWPTHTSSSPWSASPSSSSACTSSAHSGPAIHLQEENLLRQSHYSSLSCPRLTVHKHLMVSFILFYFSIIVYLEPYISFREGLDYRQIVGGVPGHSGTDMTLCSPGSASPSSSCRSTVRWPQPIGKTNKVNKIHELSH